MDNDQNSKIEQLKKSLYSRTSTPDMSRKGRFHDKNYEAASDWQHPQAEKEDVMFDDSQEKGSTFFHKILIGSLIFFLLALGIGAFILLRGSNIVSADNVDITVAGPVSIAGGDPLKFDVAVKNKNKVKLELVDLSVEYPTGTATAEDSTKELVRFRQSLPDINPNGTATKTLSAILYGEENAKKDINIKVEYRVAGSNAVFFKEKTYEVFINSSPVTLNVSSFTEVNSGQQFVISASVTSNSKQILKNTLLKAEYPFGFTFASSNPQSAGDTKTWNLGDMKPGQQRIIKITGKIDGQDNEQRVFKFSVGAANAKITNAIGTQFLATTQTVTLQKPFISTNLTLNGGSGDMVGNVGEPVNANITWVNNLPTNIINGQIKVVLTGTALDKTSISVDKGFYRSSDNTIVWDQTTAPELADIAAGQSGTFNFKFVPRIAQGQTNPIVNIDLSLSATRQSEQNVPEQLASTVHRVVHVASSVDLAGQILRSVGPFANTGPIPPKVDGKTTYTIVWTVSNTSSTISNAEVRSSLPSYVKWLGKISPTTENITYDQPSGGLVWKVGSIPAYTGVNGARKEVAFQVEFDPSLSQVGQSPIIVNETQLVGQDLFSGVSLTATKSALTTRFSTDPAYNSGDEQVKN